MPEWKGIQATSMTRDACQGVTLINDNIALIPGVARGVGRSSGECWERVQLLYVAAPEDGRAPS